MRLHYQMKRFNFSKLGPGLLFAGAAIGVSHLVQSTRAGANFGWGLLWALVLTNLFKYPFFQAGPRFAIATGKSLLEGYYNLGKGYLWVYFILIPKYNYCQPYMRANLILSVGSSPSSDSTAIA